MSFTWIIYFSLLKPIFTEELAEARGDLSPGNLCLGCAVFTEFKLFLLLSGIVALSSPSSFPSSPTSSLSCFFYQTVSL